MNFIAAVGVSEIVDSFEVFVVICKNDMILINEGGQGSGLVLYNFIDGFDKVEIEFIIVFGHKLFPN